MRHLKPDVSHRMRRRPSIFTTWWFRLVLGAGALVILLLLVGPSVVTGLRGTPATRIAVPAPGPLGPQTRRTPLDAEPPATVRPARPDPTVPAPAGAVNGPASAGVPPVRTEPGPPAASPEPAAPPAVASVPAPAVSAVPAVPAPAPAPGTLAPAVEPAPAAPSASTLPRARVPGPDGAAPGVFRVQVGAFLDHRNADRLVARLRNDNLEVVDSVSEHSRVLYRVLATPRSGDGDEAFVADIKRLGFAPELRGDSAVVTGPVSMKEAVEVSRTLRERGFRVRLERQASSGSFRVVRVGEFATAEEAERLRTQLQSRGLEGIVVRER